MDCRCRPACSSCSATSLASDVAKPLAPRLDRPVCVRSAMVRRFPVAWSGTGIGTIRLGNEGTFESLVSVSHVRCGLSPYAGWSAGWPGRPAGLLLFRRVCGRDDARRSGRDEGAGEGCRRQGPDGDRADRAGTRRRLDSRHSRHGNSERRNRPVDRAPMLSHHIPAFPARGGSWCAKAPMGRSAGDGRPSAGHQCEKSCGPLDLSL